MVGPRKDLNLALRASSWSLPQWAAAAAPWSSKPNKFPNISCARREAAGLGDKIVTTGDRAFWDGNMAQLLQLPTKPGTARLAQPGQFSESLQRKDLLAS